MNKVEPKTLPGFMELLPSDQVKFNQMRETIQHSYEKFGFLPLDTPIIESSEVLLAKAGGETEKQISENNLQNIFILLGEKSEPYPYMGQCDIYVQPSLYEGKSIAIDEAKCLCRPIVVTNFSTVHDQITDGVNGLICRMDKTDMADKIELLIDSKEERKKLIENLKREEIGNENEIKKLYTIIDG